MILRLLRTGTDMPPLSPDDLMLLRNALGWVLVSLLVAHVASRWYEAREKRREQKPKRAPRRDDELTAGEIVRRQELRRARTYSDARR